MRVLAAAVAVALGWLPGRAILFGTGPMAVRRFEWTSDGLWHLERPDGTRETACLAGATATLGPWILLAWTVGNAQLRPGCRRYALIEVTRVGPEAWRTLKGRLSIEAFRIS